MFNKVSFVVQNKLMILSNENLVHKCLDSNVLVATLALEELVRRAPIDINISDDILSKVILKLSIEQIWDLVSRNIDSKLCILAHQRLNEFFDYYQMINLQPHQDKVCEGKKTKLYLMK